MHFERMLSKSDFIQFFWGMEKNILENTEGIFILITFEPLYKT